MKKQRCPCGKCDITKTDIAYRENDVLFIHAEIGCYQIAQSMIFVKEVLRI